MLAFAPCWDSEAFACLLNQEFGGLFTIAWASEFGLETAFLELVFAVFLGFAQAIVEFHNQLSGKVTPCAEHLCALLVAVSGKECHSLIRICALQR